MWRHFLELTQPTKLHQSGAPAGAGAWVHNGQQPTIPTRNSQSRRRVNLSTRHRPVSAACTTYTTYTTLHTTQQHTKSDRLMPNRLANSHQRQLSP